MPPIHFLLNKQTGHEEQHIEIEKVLFISNAFGTIRYLFSIKECYCIIFIFHFIVTAKFSRNIMKTLNIN